MNTKNIIICLLTACWLIGCTKNYTTDYADPENPGLAIFSATENNIMSCFINNQPWKTNDRTTTFFAGARYEVSIEKRIMTGPVDLLTIRWIGNYRLISNGSGAISLILSIPKNFSYKNFSTFKGQRLVLDTLNGYFDIDIPNVNTNNTKGRGNVYFHNARLDSLTSTSYRGTISGMFDANFGQVGITRGRFDHSITPEQISF